MKLDPELLSRLQDPELIRALFRTLITWTAALLVGSAVALTTYGFQRLHGAYLDRGHEISESSALTSENFAELARLNGEVESLRARVMLVELREIERRCLGQGGQLTFNSLTQRAHCRRGGETLFYEEIETGALPAGLYFND